MKRLFSKKITVFILALATFFLVGYAYQLIRFDNFNKLKTDINKQVSSNENLPLDAKIISPQGVNISVMVADTEKEWELGLSYFSSLSDHQGMLFVFPQVGIYGFWMKDMNFPIDIVWIDETLKIIGRNDNISPESFPKTFTPPGPVRYVIELPANSALRDGFLIGNKILLQYDK